jgi:hypothetical protein
MIYRKVHVKRFNKIFILFPVKKRRKEGRKEGKKKLRLKRDN